MHSEAYLHILRRIVALPGSTEGRVSLRVARRRPPAAELRLARIVECPAHEDGAPGQMRQGLPSGRLKVAPAAVSSASATNAASPS
jgi:hypothetical protein